MPSRGRLRASQIQNGGRQVEHHPGLMRFRVGRNFSREPRDARNANAAFPKCAFAFGERRVAPKSGEAAVVAGENDEGVLGQMIFVERF